MNREIIADLLDNEMEIIEASDGLEALDLVDRYGDEISVILLDVVMPVMDGFGFLEEMKKRNLIEKYPIIVITGAPSREIDEKCFRYGIIDFIRKPFNEVIVKKRVLNSVSHFELKNDLQRTVEEQTIELKAQNEKLQKYNDNIIYLLGSVVEARNQESGLHIKRVTEFTEIIAKDVEENYPEYHLSDEDVRILKSASALHDVGKIMISDSILLKPGKLTKDEFELMKQHSVMGCDVLSKAEDLWDKEYYDACEQICRYHHERYDGKGYPDGLAGDQIPIFAQIVSLADTYDALVTRRVYKEPYTTERAYEMIQGGECGAFSPKILASFDRCRPAMEALVSEAQ